MINEIEYIVTGAAGFLGSNVAETLLKQGKSVRAFALKGDKAADALSDGIQIFYGDLTDDNSLEDIFTVEKGKEIVVIHCASIVTVDDHYSKLLYDVNVNGTKNIVKRCLKHNVKKLVHISSTGAIPELPKKNEIVEIDSFNPKKVVGHYGKSKALATQYVINAVKNDGLNASIVYPSGICGPHDYAFGPVSKFIMEFVSGEMSAGIAGSFNAVDVRDLADGVIACIDKGRKGEGYIMANEDVTIRQMFDLISNASGCKNVKTIIPKGVALTIARVLKLITKITKKPTALTPYAVYNLSRNNNFSYKKAQFELGYKVRPFSETINDEIEWLTSINKIPAKKATAKKSEVV
ncbi:MAG: NAD-dependent epimerase/dehydratase family protein [Pleomorphochaeta sp.]